MDQQKLQAGLRRPRRRAAAPRPQSLPIVPVIPLDLDILESRTLYSGTPLVLDALDVETTEDAPNTDLNLHDLFSLDDGGGVVEFQLVENSHPGLFAGVAIDGSDHLILDFGDDAHGLADLTLRATNAAGQVEVLPIHVHVAPINDAPTAIDLQSVTVTDLDQGRTTIDLFAAFDDLEDADEDLTYTIAENTNPGLFASISIDESRGLLILEHAAGQSGTANLTIVATDTGHLSVGMETSPDFKVYDEINYLGPGELPSDQIGLSELSLWTSWYFFPYENGEYRYDELAYDKFLNFLNTFPDEMVDEPVVFDIENSFFENTPEGRDRFAEVFSLAKELRPDLEIGLYRFMPERSWRHAVNWYRAQEHFEMGIESWYTNNAALFEQNHEDWLSRNALYRTAPVSAEFGGQPLADLVDAVHPSLYTPYQDDPMEPIWRHVHLDPSADTLTVDGPAYESGDLVRLKITTGSVLNNGLAQWTDYYVANASGTTFQLSQTPGGTPIDFSNNFTGEVFAGVLGPTWDNLWHDPNVAYWKVYAEENIAEARKFEKPVYAWLSPSIRAVGEEMLEPDFFRYQLELMRSLADSVAIYEFTAQTAEFHASQGWWTALSEFMETLDRPAASVAITIPSATAAQSPIAHGDSLRLNEDQPLTFAPSVLLENDSHAAGTELTALLVRGPEHGTLQQLASGQWRYTPDANFHGIDTLTYRAFDGDLYSGIATVQIETAPVDDLPLAQNDEFDLEEDQPLRLVVANLLANDTDADGDPLQFAVVEGPENGSLSHNADGTLYYRPRANFSGTDHFVYSVRDAAGHVAQATATLNVLPTNDRPVAVADRLQTQDDRPLRISAQDLLENDVDAEGDAVTIQLVAGPVYGQLVDLGNGQFDYLPPADFAGEDQFTYRVSDGALNSLATAVAIDVTRTNRPLVAVPDAFVVAEDQRLVLQARQLLANDPGVDAAQVDLQLVDQPLHGSVRRGANGAIIYVPHRDFTGVDRFGYQLSDGGGNSDVVAVQIRVTPQNDAPQASGESYQIRAGEVLRVPGAGVLANDLDLDGDRLRARVLAAPRHGSLELSPTGSFIYRPNQGFSGEDAFRYDVIDELGGRAVAQATIRVQALPSNGNRIQPALANAAPFVLIEANSLRATSPGITSATSDRDDELTELLFNPPTQ